MNTLSEEQIAILRLIRCTRVGVQTFWTLLRLYGTAQKALEALPSLANRGGSPKYTVCPLSVVEEEWEKTQRLGGKFLFWNEENFPPLLKEIPDRPPVLSWLGNEAILESLRTKSVLAIVGARNASLNGGQFATTLAKKLGQRNFVIVSGLARGIDARAHEGSLTTGTCAVMAGGVDIIYPPENTALYEKIKQEGVIFTEMPLKTAPQAALFPKRNRIIAGLSLGTVVVEAALRSGSLLTADFALEYGREVFAVPGSPFDPRCRGTNALLKKGATLVEGPEDIFRALNTFSVSIAQKCEKMELPPLESASEKIVKEAREQILQWLSPTPTKLDSLLEALPCSLSAALTALVELEVTGQISYTAGRYVCLNIAAFPEEKFADETGSC